MNSARSLVQQSVVLQILCNMSNLVFYSKHSKFYSRAALTVRAKAHLIHSELHVMYVMFISEPACSNMCLHEWARCLCAQHVFWHAVPFIAIKSVPRQCGLVTPLHQLC